jgi:hypothetical protein
MTIAVRQSVWNSQNATVKTILRFAAARLQLGQPVTYLTPGGVAWDCYDDDRFDLRDLAFLGALTANLAALANFVLDQGKPTRDQMLAWAAGKVTWPDQIDYTGQSNPYQFTLTQNGAPAAIQAADSVPANWTPQVAS